MTTENIKDELILEMVPSKVGDLAFVFPVDLEIHGKLHGMVEGTPF